VQHKRRGRPSSGQRRPRRGRHGYAALAAVGILTLAACSESGSSDGKKPAAERGSDDGSSDKGGSSAALALSPVADGRDVIPGEPLTVTAKGGKLTSLTVTTGDGQAFGGSLSSDGTSWTSSRPTGYGVSYTVKARLAGSGGKDETSERTFTTLGKDKIFVGTYNVEKGSTVGVALPVSIVFNKPIQDKAAIERKLKVTSSPAVEGAWSWLKDRDGKDRIDYRPREYWKPGTEVKLTMDLVGVENGDLVGTQRREIDFTVGKSVVSTVDVAKKTMTVAENGEVTRTLPVSTGKQGFETWNGTMVVMSKVPTIRMNSATVGIFGAEAYDLGAVKWDVQLTTSGTYAHAAPWNDGKFGRVNASHGCIGLSEADAEWFYERMHYGDPVTVVNSKDTVAVNNGYGAWNLDWEDWKKGSALS
jgi:lipoprotein-anchoring transpeptidase ErfK/SrfK